jgi:hypothetical protein
MQLGTNRIVVVDRWRSVERLFVMEAMERSPHRSENYYM